MSRRLLITLGKSRPTTLVGGAALYLNADLNTDVTTDGSAVGSWTDPLSGAAFTQATAGKKPTLRVGRYNGHNSISFVSANSTNLTTAAAVSAINTPDSTVFVVAKGLIDGGGAGRVFANYDPTHFQGFHVTQVGSSNVFDGFSGTGAALTTTTIGSSLTASGLHAMAFVCDHNASKETPYYDGTVGTVSSAAYAYQTTAPVVASVGSDRGTGNFADTDLCCVIVYPWAMVLSQIMQNLSALKTTYGTP